MSLSNMAICHPKNYVRTKETILSSNFFTFGRNFLRVIRNVNSCIIRVLKINCYKFVFQIAKKNKLQVKLIRT